MKSDQRTELDRLMAAFKGEIKRCPPAPASAPKVKGRKDEKVERKTQGLGEMTEKPKPTGEVPPDGGKTKDYGDTAHDDYSEFASDRTRPGHRAFRMPKDKRSQAYLQMDMSEHGDEFIDDAWHLFGTKKFKRQKPEEAAREARFRRAAKTGADCGLCGSKFESGWPVWLAASRKRTAQLLRDNQHLRRELWYVSSVKLCAEPAHAARTLRPKKLNKRRGTAIIVAACRRSPRNA